MWPKPFSIHDARILTVERDGHQEQVVLGTDIADRILDRNEKTLFTPCVPFFVDTLLPEGTAKDSDLEGDRSIGVNGTSTPYFAQFREAVAEHKDEEAQLTVLRGSDTLVVPVRINEAGLDCGQPVAGKSICLFRKFCDKTK